MWRKSYVEYSIFAVKNLRVSKSNTDTWQKLTFVLLRLSNLPSSFRKILLVNVFPVVPNSKHPSFRDDVP